MSLLWTALALLAVLVLLLFAEYIARTRNVHTELTRKFVHMSVGTFVAFWPFFLSWHEIAAISLGFLIVVLLSVRYGVFRSIHAVKRSSSGEVLFAVIIGLLALISSAKWIFTAAMLHLSVADGLAAIVGILWGDSNQYKVLGKVKSVAGSGTFFGVSLLILIAYTLFGDGLSIGFFGVIGLALLATAVENIAAYGTDNVAVPLVVALVLSGGGL